MIKESSYSNLSHILLVNCLAEISKVKTLQLAKWSIEMKTKEMPLICADVLSTFYGVNLTKT